MGKLHSFIIFIISILLSFQGIVYADASRAVKSKSVHNKENRVAVVIGNSDYASNPLKNPVNDAKSLASVLRSQGFKVYDYYNLSLTDIRRVTDKLADQNITNGGTALFYFAGHGLQSGGRNYLVPVNASIRSENDIEFEALNLDRVISKMEQAKNRVNIVILDACRNNPFAAASRSMSSGLATVDAPIGSFIAYATAPGKVASDGASDNGVFTGALVEVLSKTKGITIEQVFKYVRSKVRVETDGDQIPWTSSSMEGDFFFAPSDTQVVQLNVTKSKPAPAVNTSDDASIFTDRYTGMVLKHIPAGCFKMGSEQNEKNSEPDETPLHRVCLGDFYIGIHEVTQQQWMKIMGFNPSNFQSCGGSCPVENISWTDAVDFAKQLSEKTGKNFRLPTEAEWEYAAKAGLKTTPSNIDNIAWHRGNSQSSTHQVGTKQPNPFGLYDMLGNVQEWCNDNYEYGYYSFSPKNNPKGPEDDTRKTLRGGSWVEDISKVRLTNRRGISEFGTGPYIGLRLVMTD